MKIRLFYIGKDSKNFYKKAEEEFSKRIERYISFETHALAPPRHSQSLSVNEIREKEAHLIQEKLPSNSILILLDEKGKSYSSNGFSRFIENKISLQTRDISFVIGGAMGFSQNFKSRADVIIKLSDLTLPHHLARIVFLEQLYRAFTIIRGESYHNS